LLGIDFLVKNPWAAVVVWMALYISDYALTIKGAGLRLLCQDYICSEGYELTPYYRQDIAALRRVSPRFLFQLIFSSALLVIMWWLSMVESRIPELFEGMLGALILVELSIHLRHFQNIVTFLLISRSGGVTGRIVYSLRLTLRISAWDMAAHAALWLLLAVLTGRWFFVGGAVKCLATANQHWKLAEAERAKRAKETNAIQPSQEEPHPTHGE
jgi:hypothetical protein